MDHSPIVTPVPRSTHHLVEPLTAGEPGAAHEIRRLLAATDDSGARAEILDPLALSAARSLPALDLLLWAVDELALDRPALRRLLVTEADLDEAHQDVLIAVAETVGGYRGDARFTTWLHQVARYKAIALLRRRRPDHPGEAELLDETTPPPGDAARLSSIIAARVSVEQVIASLPEHYRQPVVLRDVESLPYDAIAERLDLNLNTAKARVARGRALVAAGLGER